MLKTVTLLSAALLSLPAAASAQAAPEAQVVDRVLAVVGDSVVLQSQVEEEIQRMRLGGMQTPTPAEPGYEDFFDQTLDDVLNRVLVLQAAAKDTLIRADEARIEQQVTSNIDQLVQSFGGRAALVEALESEGLTLSEYRDILRNQARQLQIHQMYLQNRLRDARSVEVSEEEMLQRFESARGQLQQRPRLLTFKQVVLVPEASDEAKDSARAQAESVLQRIREGEPFDQLARRYSDDTGSAQLGGDLGWFRRGRMVREFEEVAFALPTGVVSPVVETEFGFHIIRIDRARQGERQGRHILIMPDKSDADIQRTRSLAEEIARAAREGASMDSLHAEHSDPAAPDSLTVPFDQIGQLPGAYDRLRQAQAGEVVGPLEYDSGGEARFAVVRVEEIREAGAYTFEDVRPQLASQLQQEKQVQRVIEDLRERTHIRILR